MAIDIGQILAALGAGAQTFGSAAYNDYQQEEDRKQQDKRLKLTDEIATRNSRIESQKAAMANRMAKDKAERQNYKDTGLVGDVTAVLDRSARKGFGEGIGNPGEFSMDPAMQAMHSAYSAGAGWQEHREGEESNINDATASARTNSLNMLPGLAGTIGTDKFAEWEGKTRSPVEIMEGLQYVPSRDKSFQSASADVVKAELAGNRDEAISSRQRETRGAEKTDALQSGAAYHALHKDDGWYKKAYDSIKAQFPKWSDAKIGMEIEDNKMEPKTTKKGGKAAVGSGFKKSALPQ